MNSKSSSYAQSPEVVVVEASAGSGKTYALAKRYLQLLINESSHPEYIRKILAITFTNQTTREMKERILEFLKKIALDKFSDPQEENDILSSLPVDKYVARKKASQLMDYIIRNYNFFQVQTIDSFINVVLSGCAYRLKLSANFKIREDYQDYLTYSLDECIDRANRNESIRALFDNFLQQYLYIENKSSWFPKRDILNLIGSLFYHATIYGGGFKKFDLKNKNLFLEKKKTLKLLKQLRENAPVGTNKTFLNSLDNFLLKNRESFDIRSITEKKSFLLNKFPMNKGYPAPANIERLWKRIRNHTIDLAEKEALSLFNYYIDIFQLVYQVFREYASKEDALFLEELNQQAKILIGENNVTVPELYYRLATRFAHYLIDEFQDTSDLQWQNLFLMVEDALSSGGSLFYVGDKKQAIYRFRGGEVSLFNKIKDGLSAFNVKPASLNTNYRSQKEIVEFNNAIFSETNLRRFLKAQQPSGDGELKRFTKEDIDEIVDVFSDSKQAYKKEKVGGLVKVEQVVCQDKEERDEKIKEQFLKLIEDLRKRFGLKDLAVLCRSNKDVELVSGWLIASNIAVESEKTLNIKNNRFIKELISFLKFLNSPIDNLSFTSFILGEVFLKATGTDKQKIENFLFALRPRILNDKTFYIYRNFRKTYPDIWNAYIEDFFKNVGFVGFYELVVDILKKLRVFKNFPQCQGFFMRFLELIKDNEEEHPSIKDFLEYFENAQDDKLYVNSSATDAVKVMSIHKAKGLGFSVVVLPFLELDITGLSSRGKRGRVSYVVNPGQDGLLSLRRLDSKYAKLSSLIRTEYRKEYKKSFIDELNTIYVAFTRAQNELYIFIPHGMAWSSNAARFLITEDYFQRGKPRTYEADHRDDAVSLTIPSPFYKDWISFLKDEFVDPSTIKNRQSILRGEVLHTMLSYIGNLSQQDKEEALKYALDKARVGFAFIDDLAEFESIVRKLLDEKEAKRFFWVDDGQVYQEKEVVEASGFTKRIDRLILREKEAWVIDYKSRGESVLDFKEQLTAYLAIIRDLYPDKTVRGFIIFLEDIRIEEIHG